jgi:hypothetical protein
MSTTYFANGSRFNPPKRTALPILYEITGKLIDARPKPRNNDDYWLIIQLMTEDDLISVYFAQKAVLATDVDLLNSLYGRVVTLRSKSGNPEICTISVKSEESLRSRLLDGVIANQYKMEDLPALIAFSRGDDSMFEKWQLFKQQIDQEGVAKAKEELNLKNTKLQSAIDREWEKWYELNAIHQEVFEKQQELLRELEDALVLMQGEDHPQGTGRSGLNGVGTENLVSIDTGYNNLLDAIEKFRPQRGIFVICGDEIHKIHHAYVEDKGRVFLLGSAQEFNRRGREASREIVDRILHLLYPENHPEK